MSRVLGLVLTIVLLSLASGVVPAPRFEKTESKTVAVPSDFHDYAYDLGSFSYLFVETLSGEGASVEGATSQWSCRLVFGNPASNYSQWVHPVELDCNRDSEHYIFPLGEAEFSRAYVKGRTLIKGDAAEALAKILNENADDRDVESPISERIIAWGPARSMQILSLRRSGVRAKLVASLECYRDSDTKALHSCALSY